MGGVEQGEIRWLINEARRNTLIAVVALQRGVLDDRTTVAVDRARHAVEAASRDLQDRRGVLGALLDSTRRWVAHALPARAFGHSIASAFTLPLPSKGYFPLAINANGVLLEELDLDEIDLRGASLNRAILRRCRLKHSVLSDSALQQGVLESCDLSRARLDRARLPGIQISGSRLLGTSLVDAILDNATFTRCDLRGADLSAPQFGEGASAAGTRFIECDLRNTNWRRRWLCGVTFAGCKLHGMRGEPRLDDAEIDGADLSIAGDGSLRATAGDAVHACR